MHLYRNDDGVVGDRPKYAHVADFLLEVDPPHLGQHHWYVDDRAAREGLRPAVLLLGPGVIGQTVHALAAQAVRGLLLLRVIAEGNLQ